MEDLAEESLYFLLKSDLLSSLEIGRRQNSHSKTENSGVQDRRLVFITAFIAWNNGKEVPRWGVAEIQKMSPSTTGRCK